MNKTNSDWINSFIDDRKKKQPTDYFDSLIKSISFNNYQKEIDDGLENLFIKEVIEFQKNHSNYSFEEILKAIVDDPRVIQQTKQTEFYGNENVSIYKISHQILIDKKALIAQIGINKKKDAILSQLLHKVTGRKYANEQGKR